MTPEFLPQLTPNPDHRQLARLMQRIEETVAEAYAPNTRRLYIGAFTRFAQWAADLGLRSTPADTKTVCGYFVARSDAGCALATVRADRTAISALHRTLGHPDPCATPIAIQTMKGLARSRAGEGQRQATALTAEGLAAIRATAHRPRIGPTGRSEHRKPAARRGDVDIAIASVMRDALLRVSEAAAITWSDIEHRADRSARLTIRRSKTDQEGAGCVAFLSPATASALSRIRPLTPAQCPRVLAVRALHRPQDRLHEQGRWARGILLRT